MVQIIVIVHNRSTLHYKEGLHDIIEENGLCRPFKNIEDSHKLTRSAVLSLSIPASKSSTSPSDETLESTVVNVVVRKMSDRSLNAFRFPSGTGEEEEGGREGGRVKLSKHNKEQ